MIFRPDRLPLAELPKLVYAVTSIFCILYFQYFNINVFVVIIIFVTMVIIIIVIPLEHMETASF